MTKTTTTNDTVAQYKNHCVCVFTLNVHHYYICFYLFVVLPSAVQPFHLSIHWMASILFIFKCLNATRHDTTVPLYVQQLPHSSSNNYLIAENELEKNMVFDIEIFFFLFCTVCVRFSSIFVDDQSIVYLHSRSKYINK